MPFLIIQEKSQPDRTHHIEGDELVIGRGQKADLVFPNVSVSRFHSKFFGGGEGWHITDMGSQNGTIVNKKKVETAEVNSGDTIVLGKYTLIFVGDETLGLWKGKDLATYPIYGGRVSVEQDSTFALSAAMIQKMREIERKKNFACITSDSNEEQYLLGEGTLTIGGSGGIPFKGLLSFTKGASITWDGSDHLVHKSGLTNVTVNGIARKSQRLRDGDAIMVGKTSLKYEISDS